MKDETSNLILSEKNNRNTIIVATEINSGEQIIINEENDTDINIRINDATAGPDGGFYCGTDATNWENDVVFRINPDKSATDHIDWVVNRSNYVEKWKRFYDLLLGKNCRDLIN